MIIELCGLPGSGKTTIVESMKLNTHLADRNEFLSQNTIRFRILKKLVYFSFFRLPLLNDITLIKEYLQTYPPCEKKYVCRLLDMYVAYQSAKKNVIYVLDEGAIQYITSICYNSQMVSNDDLAKIVKLFYKRNKSYVSFVEVEIQDSIKRIKKRNFPYDRYNLDSDEKMRILLEQKAQNIQTVLKVAENNRTIKVISLKDIKRIISTDGEKS